MENTPLNTIRLKVRQLRLEPALLFLNHLLATARDFTEDHALRQELCHHKFPVLPHIVHFLAKEIACSASKVGPAALDVNTYFEFQRLAVLQADPIQYDPGWHGADPTGFLIRVFAQQFPAQDRRVLQKYGVALGLYRDVGRIVSPIDYDLRAETEAVLRTDVAAFMSMGHVVSALKGARHRTFGCSGTFRPELIAEAFAQGITVCVPEVWTPFLDRVSCDLDRFRDVASRPPYVSDRPHSTQFELNPLRRFPILNVGEQKYIAVDPDLIVDRVTLGLFYDLFDAGGTQFSERFGYALDAFIGRLLAASAPRDRLWAEADVRQEVGARWRPPSQNADRAYRGQRQTVLLECKSLRPSLELIVGGSDEAVRDFSRRIASATRQITRHSRSIADGQWDRLGLPSRECVGIVVTYGKMYTANGPFVRRLVRDILAADGVDPVPYVVLSLDELDAVLSLVNEARPLDEIVGQLASDEGAFDPLTRFYEDELRINAISRYCRDLGRRFLDEIMPDCHD